MAGGTFESDTGGTFQTATDGTFVSATAGTFPDFVIASPLPELTTRIWLENPIFSSYLVGTHTFVEYAKFGCVTQNALL
jgi:hypothetical protein